MAINFRPTSVNLNTSGIANANSSALDNFRRSLQGFTSGLADIDKQRDQAARDAFANRLAGLSIDQLENFNVNEAAQGNRLRAVTLRDMLKQRTADERKELEAEYNRNKIEEERTTRPIIDAFTAQMTNSKLQGASTDTVIAATEQFLKDNPNLPQAAVNKIRNLSLGTTDYLDNETKEALKYQQYQEDRERKLASQDKQDAYIDEQRARADIAHQRQQKELEEKEQLKADKEVMDIFTGRLLRDNPKAGINELLKIAKESDYGQDLFTTDGANELNALLDNVRTAHAGVDKERAAGVAKELKLGQENIEDRKNEELRDLSYKESQQNLYQQNKAYVAENTDNRDDTTIYGRGGAELQTDLDNYYNKGISIDGVTISKDDLDQQAVSNALNNYFDKSSGLFGFDEGVRDTDSFERAIVLGSLEAKRNRVQEKIIKAKFNAESRALARGQVPNHLDSEAQKTLANLNKNLSSIEQDMNKVKGAFDVEAAEAAMIKAVFGEL